MHALGEVQLKYFIPQTLIEIQAKKEARSFYHPPELRTGEIAIFNKNALTFQIFRDCRPCLDRYGYLGETGNLDPHFANVILEEP